MRPSSATGAACLIAALCTTGTALAAFGRSSSDTLRVSTAVLVAPSGVNATVDACRPGDSVDVQVDWTASTSGATDGYTVLRSDGGGPSTQVGTVSGRDTTSFLDPARPFGTTSTYTVEATRADWSSAASSGADVTTPASNCS